MESFLVAAAESCQRDLLIKFEVFGLVREMVEDVEIWHYENVLQKTRRHLGLSEGLNNDLVTKVKLLQGRNSKLETDLLKMRLRAAETRESFVGEVGQFLEASRCSQKLKERVNDLQKKVEVLTTQVDEHKFHAIANGLDSPAGSGSGDAENGDGNGAAGGGEEAVGEVGVVGKGAGGTVEGGIRESGNTGEGEAGEGGQVSGEGEQEGAVLSEGQLQEQREQREQLFFLYDLEDESLMHIFSYLDTVEVLHIAQVCKFVLVRVDRLFGIESSVIQPEWETRPTAADRQLLLQAQVQAQAQAQAQAEIQAQAAIQAQKQIQGQAQGQGGAQGLDRTSSEADLSAVQVQMQGQGAESRGQGQGTESRGQGQVGPADPILSKEIIDVLIKKLTAAELKVILSIAERSKKQGAQIDNLSAEKEDISARLQNTESVRNFLIEKLKAAEVEIKSLMGTNSALKRQGKSDEEIIGYLDLRANELESHKQDLSGRANQLQASLDLSQASHSHREAQLSSELSDWKLKYEKLDVNFKAQKRVLIKEVKGLRAQVEVLSNEKSITENSMRKLREALGGLK